MKKEQIKELVLYFIFGVLTTVVSLVCFKLFDWLLGENLYLISNALSWVIAVIFAFVTNKLWVFDSKSWQAQVVLKEALSFFGARLFGLGVEEGGLWLLISVLGFKDLAGFMILQFKVNGNLIAKCIMTVAVVVINYVFSKFFVFKKRDSNAREE